MSCHHRPDIDFTHFDRGDEVRMVDCGDNGQCFYIECKKLTYLAGQALDNQNMVWILAQGCPWYQYPELKQTISMATFQTDLRNIVRGHNSDNVRPK